MTKLTRNLRFYSYVITLTLAMIILGFIIYLIFQEDEELSRKLFPTILFGGGIIFLIYLLIDLFLRVPNICFDKKGINTGNKNLQWKEIHKIIFDVNAQYLGYSQVITYLHTETKEIKIFNQYYKNFSLLSEFIVIQPLASICIEPDLENFSKKSIAGFENKIYKGYRIFSTHLLFSFYSFFVIVIALKAQVFGSLNIIVTTPFLIFVLLFLYLPNYVMIEDGNLIIKKLFLPIIIYKLPLNNLYAIKYYNPARAPRIFMCINKKFESKRFYMETLPVKKFKELKNDLEKGGIVVIDDLAIEPMNMTFNTKFNLFGKKGNVDAKGE